MSPRKATRDLAETPTLFGFISHPDCPYIIIPSVSSEKRFYIPMNIMSADVIASNLCLLIPTESKYIFGVLQSRMHMGWMRQVCGRLKSDYRYSNKIVYNNFPWPKEPNEVQVKAVEAAAQGVLDARAAFPNSTLADLYDPNSMPPKLVKAHQDLDKAVDRCYGKKSFANETERLEFLFELYQEYLKKAEEKNPSKKKTKKEQ